MRIVAISDTHGLHRQVKLPEADILIHAGDQTMYGELDIMQDFAHWLRDIPIKSKCVVFGNHEMLMDREPNKSKAINMIKESGAHYLENSGVEIEGIKIFGCPFTPNLPRWAFQEYPGCFDAIPEDTQILINHGPIKGILDNDVMQYGSEYLRKIVYRLMEKSLTHLVHGHIHECGSQMKVIHNSQGRDFTFVNASSCDITYRATNPVMSFEV